MIGLKAPQDGVPCLQRLDPDAAISQFVVDSVNPVPLTPSFILEIVDLSYKQRISLTLVFEGDAAGVCGGLPHRIKNRHFLSPIEMLAVPFRAVAVVDDQFHLADWGFFFLGAGRIRTVPGDNAWEQESQQN